MVLKPVLLALAGVAAGFFNVNAGGGSLITLPALIFLGLPSATANGTNRIALLFESAAGVAAFRKKGYFDPGLSIRLAIPAVAGSILGAQVAVEIPDLLFNRILAGVMILVLVLILFKQGSRVQDAGAALTPGRKIALMVAFFFVGLYGGFIQAGVGFIIMTVMSLLTSMSLVRINSVKVLVVGLYMISSIVVFLLNGHVDWLYGLVLAAGNMMGAWLGTHFSVRRGDRWIKVVLAVAVAGMAARLLGAFDLLFG